MTVRSSRGRTRVGLPQMTLVFPAIKKISNELGGQCTKKPTAGRWGLGQMIPPDEKGTKAAEHKVRHNF